MSSNILSIGECMIELSGAEGGLLRQSFAGDVVNTLWYARAALGDDWRCQFYSAVGTDIVSDQMIEFLQSAGLDCSHVQRIADRRPGLYMIHLNGAERSFSYWRDSSAARLLARDRDRLRAAINDAEVVYFSGITLAILSKPDQDCLLDCLERAAKSGKMVAFDPNIRPALWSDAQDMRDTIQRAGSLATVVLPSFDDEESAFGDASSLDTLQRYGAGNGKAVVVKNGAGQVLAQVQSEVLTLDVETVTDPVDTTGAGDSFNGAFLASYARTLDMKSSILAGCHCAAQVICEPGGLVAHDRLDV